MKVARDIRLEEFNRIEHLLYGINYEVWFNLYGPGDTEVSLEKALRSLVSRNCKVSSTSPSNSSHAQAEILEMVLYKGDNGAGPLELEAKAAEITSLMDKVFSLVNLSEADIVLKFGFKEGQPSHPVFWDFAYDIHSRGQRWILVGSSSD